MSLQLSTCRAIGPLILTARQCVAESLHEACRFAVEPWRWRADAGGRGLGGDADRDAADVDLCPAERNFIPQGHCAFDRCGGSVGLCPWGMVETFT